MDKISLEEAIRLIGEVRLEDERPSAIHLAETLWEEAIEGNMRAAKMILEYTIGRPKLSLEAVEDLRELDADLKRALNKAYGTDEDPEILFGEDGNPVERPYADDSDHIPFK